MGVIFTEHPGGLVLYVCRACHTVFSNQNEHIGYQTRNRILKVPAYLFNKVVNVTYSEIQNHPNVPYTARLVNCKKCSTSLGMMYEYPHAGSKKYKKKHAMDINLIAVLEGFHET